MQKIEEIIRRLAAEIQKEQEEMDVHKEALDLAKLDLSDEERTPPYEEPDESPKRKNKELEQGVVGQGHIIFFNFH